MKNVGRTRRNETAGRWMALLFPFLASSRFGLARAELVGQAVGCFFEAAAIGHNSLLRSASDVETLGFESKCRGNHGIDLNPRARYPADPTEPSGL